MKILLVEDNPIDRMFVTESLKQVTGFSYDLTVRESLAGALSEVAASSYDVILLDLWLPDCEGLETCHRLVAAVHDVPIVVMTGTDDRLLAADAMRSGAQDYLVKGAFPGSAIARVLQYAIDRYHFQRERRQQDNHYQEILSRVPAIIWTTDLNLEIKSAMGAGLQLLNQDPRQLVGRTLAEYLLSTGNPGGAISAHQRALRGQSVGFEAEWLGRSFAIKIDPLHEPDRSVSGTIGVALDVTERRNLDREINFARLVQQGLLPTDHPHVDGFEISGGSFAATQTCGDWFDYLTFSDESLGLVVGDVSGHGFGPAILSATVAAYLEVLAEHQSDIQQIMNSCNRLVCRRSLDGQFAVLSLARLEASNRTLSFGGAGDGMLIIRRDGQLKHKLASSGFPMGLVDDVCYEPPSHVELESGDVLLLLTDGFREAQDEDGLLFGESRIVETVAAVVQSSAADIFKSLRRAARQFAAGHSQQDDMTGIVIKVLDL